MSTFRAEQGSTRRALTVWVAVVALVAGILSPMTGMYVAQAAPGSLISGVAWADVNRDGIRQSTEALKPGITMRLLTSPGGVVVATTTTGTGGVYRFQDVADGAFVVQADASPPFLFPATRSGDNDFASTGTPPVGQPQRGVTTPITISGAPQVTGIDAGMQPIADLTVARLPVPEGCDGFAVTGTPPFDATDGPGLDSGPGNCIVRVGDTVSQNYSVALTGLPTGASVPNVVAVFRISSPDGGKLELVGPGTNGLPSGCLGAANGAVPQSSRTLNPDGSISVTCNVGTMSSNVAALQIAYRFASDTPVPSHASIDMSAYAAGGDAGASTTVSGPAVEVTGTAQWDLEKIPYPASSNGGPGPSFTVLTVGGVPLEGYFVRYQFNIVDALRGRGSGDLVWPATFTDVMPGFPNARIVECRSRNGADVGGASPWTLTCPAATEVQGTDGWQLGIRPNSGHGGDTGEGHVVMKVFVPLNEMNRAINPAWQPGDPIPTGTFSFENKAQGTDHWAINGGAPNFGPNHEPGWDGTGNNLAVRVAKAAAPQWDLQKSFLNGPFFSTQTVNGQQVDGYIVQYNLTIRDLAGPDNVGPWLDSPVTFKDRLVSHPGAILLACAGTGFGTPSCQPGVQPAGGWNLSFVPNQVGFDARVGQIRADIFIPMSQIPADPCQSNVTLDLRNEAIGSEHWTVQGQPNNGTGFEPGWDGTTATGNNLDVRSIRPASGECGVLAGNKQYVRNGFTYNGPTFGGDVIMSFVSVSANNNRVKASDLRLCDVFDVSVLKLASTPAMGSYPAGVDVNPANYVIEYAIGPNVVNTQAGPKDVNGVYPADISSLNAAAIGCRTAPGPWTTNPAADFGADWLDKVNMVRVRPIDPSYVETGPFAAHLIFNLETRTFYNGGPNAGQAIPSGVRVTNEGGWPAGTTAAEWGTVARQVPFAGMSLGIQKTVTPTQYLPGDSVVWDFNVWVDRATVGATLNDLQLVDTVPANLHFDLACTQSLLPPGVTVAYNATTRQVTFLAGNVPITRAPLQNIFNANTGIAPRLRLCTTVDSLAQPGDTYVNSVRATAANAENQPTATATIQVVGSGQMGISKQVDKPLVASGETYSWSLDWGNTSTVLAFQPPDVIDVLPWNGDGAPDALSGRDQFATDYVGTSRITGALAPPTYVRGGTGVGTNVPGTWYYATANPSTIDHDARSAANANPEAAGGLWLTAAEVTSFSAVTAVRFVSSTFLTVQTRVRAVIPQVATSTALDNVYVNRAMIFSATFANQPLLSNEPYVLMPGFTLGDLVWIDSNGDGKFDGTEQGVPGVTVQVRNQVGDVVGTATTDADGRWSVAALPAGTYSAHIPASMFAAGAPLADTVVRTVGSSAALPPNEGADNNNTATADPATTGLTSTPVTLTNQYVAGQLVGGNGPSGDDVAGLAGPLIPDSFTAFTVDLALLPTPGIDIEKATDGQDADDPSGPLIGAGGTVRWTYVVTNTGGVALSDVTVTDDKVDDTDIDCAGSGSNVLPGPLAPGASVTCIATGTATEGQYANTGTVTGLDPARVQVSDNDPSHYFGVRPAVDIEKATNGQDADTPTGPSVPVGSTVLWTYVVTNTGNTPLTAVAVTDDRVDASAIDCGGTGTNVIAGPLQPGDSFLCAASGTATAGQYANLGHVEGSGPATTAPDGGVVAGAVVTDDDPSHYFGVDPRLELVKASTTAAITQAGQVVPYTFTVTNTGNLTLSSVTVDDTVAAPSDPANLSAIDCPQTTLAPAAAMTCTATYTVTQADVDNGSVSDSATATGTPPATPEHPTPTPVTSPPADLTITADRTPSLTLEKSSTTTEITRAGQQVPYEFLVTNTGNTTLTGLSIDDQLTAPSDPADLSAIDCPAGDLAPGASVTCTATYTVTQADVDNGSVDNTATAGGTPPATHSDPNPPAVTSPPDAVSIPADQSASLTIEKSSTTTTIALPGEQVPYEFLVTNTGNVTLTGLTIDDQLAAPSDSANLSAIDCPQTTLAPGASTTCTATYTVSQADVDNGTVEDTATATGTPPSTAGNPDPTPVASPPDSLAIDAPHDSGLTVVKAMGDFGAATYTEGLQIPYTFVVTNTGNTTLTNIVVADIQIAPASQSALSPVTCPSTTLPARASMTCSATYTLTRADVGNGSLTDTASATATPPPTPGDPNPPALLSAPSTVTITADDLVSLTVTKSSTTTEVTRVGQQIPYRFLVENTGSVTLTDISVTDQVTAPSTPANLSAVTCPQTTLAPQETTVCTATYTARQADLDHGTVSDTATASGTPPAPPGGPTPDRVTTPPSSLTIPTTASDPGLRIDKTTESAAATAAGQRILYTFAVENTGNVTLTDIVVTDIVAAPSDQSGLSAVICPSTTLQPGERMSCTATYTVTAADMMLATSLSDTATAAGTTPDGTRTTSAQSTLALPVRPVTHLPIVTG